MRKTKRTDTISLGGIALTTLYQAARAGDVTAAIYILDHPNIGHIDVSKIMHGCKPGAKQDEDYFVIRQRKNKKGESK